jgi:hypothetical protein
MKKLLSALFILAFLTAGLGLSGQAQSVSIYVKVRPVVPVMVRPVPPSPKHIWIAEEWRPAGATYIYAGGYWAAPPKPGWIWIPGHWKRHEYGEYWVPGHWRK